MPRMTALIALALAVVVLLLALSIHFVMPTSLLAVVRLFASEVTPWLLALAVVAAGLATTTLGSGALAPRLAIGAALMTIVLAAIPLARVPGVIRDADRQLREAFGADASAERPPLSLLTTLVGQRAPDVALTRDVPFNVTGSTLRLDRYLPPGEGANRPALIVIHGGSWQAGDKGDSLTSRSEWSRLFAGRGYVVYDVQYRLAPSSHHPVPMNDVLCALAYVRTHAREDGVDPDRVVLLGRSAGAHLALLAAYRAREAPCGPTAGVAGVIALYGPTDLLAAYAFPGDPDLIGGRSVLRDFIGGTPDDARDRFLDAMPRTWLAGAVPTLLIHGEADPIVYPRHSEDLASRLRERGVPVVHLRLPWSGHGFDMISVGVGGQIALSTAERFAAAVVLERR